VNYKKVFGSKVYVSAADLAGREVPVRIARIDLDEVPDDTGNKQSRLIATFHDKPKKLILNKTNAETLEKLAASDDTEQWVGLSIVLYTARVQWKGKETDGIRIKAPATPTFADPDVAHDSSVDDDIPF
jgi:hypothetical protein